MMNRPQNRTSLCKQTKNDNLWVLTETFFSHRLSDLNSDFLKDRFELIRIEELDLQPA
jgi:hypothetical protein